MFYASNITWQLLPGSQYAAPLSTKKNFRIAETTYYHLMGKQANYSVNSDSLYTLLVCLLGSK